MFYPVNMFYPVKQSIMPPSLTCNCNGVGIPTGGQLHLSPAKTIDYRRRGHARLTLVAQLPVRVGSAGDASARSYRGKKNERVNRTISHQFSRCVSRVP